jgi:glycosyltransferase involved in cell wall biosynthesis
LLLEPASIVFFGTYDEDVHSRVRVLREGLASRGHRITVVNVPIGVGTAARVKLASQPWRTPWFAARGCAAWARLLWRSRAVHRPDTVVVGYLGAFDVHLARLRWPRSRLVLDQMVTLADTVRDRGLDRSRALVRALALTDRAAAAQADLVLVDTPAQAELVGTRDRAKVVVVPVGAPDAWFEASGGDQQRSGPLRVVFYGLYTPLQGAPIIGRTIRLLAGRDIAWTMVGDGQDRPATETAAGGVPVRWLDWVDAHRLPALVAEHDVCLGIFGTGPKGRRVVPNKVYQGAAAGCAVVTSDTPAQRDALGDGARYVPAGDPKALADAIAGLADDPAQLSSARRAAAARARRAFTPSGAVADLAGALGRAHDEEMPTGSPALPPLAPNAALRWHLVCIHVDALAPASIVECGAGQGGVACRLCRRAAYTGIEPDDTSRATAARRVPPGTRLLADIDDLDGGETFDLLCAFEVLEHIEDDKGVLGHWVERVRPGGHVLVSVPAEPDRFASADVLAGHFRRYADGDLSTLFESAGLEPVSVEHYGYPLGLALEAGRNAIAKRRLAREAAPADIAARTAGSGRHLQPPAWSGPAIWWATGPFRMLERRFPHRGPGLVGLARRPS